MNKNLTIAIIGSASTDINTNHPASEIAQHIGTAVAQHGYVLASGGCIGVPAYAIERAYANGGETVGYFPTKNDRDRRNLCSHYNNDLNEHYTHKKFISGFSERSIAMLRNSDGVIVVNGRIGTLSEFSMAVEEGLPIAVLEDSGGIADHLDYILRVVNRQFPDGRVRFCKTVDEALVSIERYHLQK